MARKIGYGPVTFAAGAVPYLSEWSVDVEHELDAVKNIASVYTVQDPKNGGWSGSVSFEYAKLGLSLGALTIGAWEGVELHEYTFTAEMDLKDSSGPNDDWKEFAPGPHLSWKLEVSKWQATDSHSIFAALLVAQVGTPAAVALTGPFGSGNVLIGKNGMSASDSPLEEKLSLEGTGTLTSSDTYVTRLAAQAAAILAAGYCAPQALILKEDAATTWGRGDAFIKSVEYKVGEGKVTGKLDWQGTGALLLGAAA